MASHPTSPPTFDRTELLMSYDVFSYPEAFWEMGYYTKGWVVRAPRVDEDGETEETNEAAAVERRCYYAKFVIQGSSREICEA